MGQAPKSRSGQPRVPHPEGDLQVNACRNPACANFGVEAKSFVSLGRPPKNAPRETDNYSLRDDRKIKPDNYLRCENASGPARSRATGRSRRNWIGYPDICPHRQSRHARPRAAKTPPVASIPNRTDTPPRAFGAAPGGYAVGPARRHFRSPRPPQSGSGSQR